MDTEYVTGWLNLWLGRILVRNINITAEAFVILHTDYINVTFFKDPVTKFHHSPGCIIARSTVTGYIVGVKIGRIVSRKDKIKKEDRFDWIAKLPKFLNLPHFLVYFSNLGPTMESLRLGPEYMFQDLEDANMIYYSQVLSVGSEARGKGLGTELMRRGYKIAKEVSPVYLTCLVLIIGNQKFYELMLLIIILNEYWLFSIANIRI